MQIIVRIKIEIKIAKPKKPTKENRERDRKQKPQKCESKKAIQNQPICATRASQPKHFCRHFVGFISILYMIHIFCG